MYYIPEAQTVFFDQRDLQSDELVSQNLWNIVIWAPEHPANMFMQVKKAVAEVNPNLLMYGDQPCRRCAANDPRGNDPDQRQTKMAIG